MYRHSVTGLRKPLTLSNCRELCELEICLQSPENVEPDLVSSITSTNIQKITFTQSLAFCEGCVENTYWPRLENSLCRLVDRLRCGHWLEVEFHVYTPQNELDFGRYLSRFREKGRVRVLDEMTKMIVYCSDGMK